MMKIKLYSKDDCPWCVKAKELMNKLHLEYVEFKLGKDFTREELRELVPENLPLTVPQIFVYNKRIGGYEDFAEYCENTGIMGLQG
jgi:glutaredoxin